MKYLISETTKEERKDLVNKALAISLSDAEYPSEEVISLANEYIEGRIELEEIQKYIVEKSTKKEKDDNE